MNAAIVQIAQQLQQAMMRVHVAYDFLPREVKPLIEEADETAGDMRTTTKQKLNEILSTISRTQGSVDNAVRLEKYQDEEVVKGVAQLLDKSINQTSSLNWNREHVFMPSLNAWRSETERVFESLGLGLDKERIAHLAAASAARPSPATHAFLTALKAGESGFQTFLRTKAGFMHIEEHNHCFMHFLASKTLSETHFPVFNERG